MRPTSTALLRSLRLGHRRLALVTLSLVLAGVTGCLPEAPATLTAPAALSPTEPRPKPTAVPASETVVFVTPVTPTPAALSPTEPIPKPTAVPASETAVFVATVTSTDFPTPEWKQYQSEVLRVKFAYPATWAIKVADNFIYLTSPDKAGFEADSEFGYFVFITQIANPDRRPFTDLVTDGLSEELKQAFKFTSIPISDYLTYQTESLPSQSGALRVFFEDGFRYVLVGLAPYVSENPFPGQDRHKKLFEALLQTVRLTK